MVVEGGGRRLRVVTELAGRGRGRRASRSGLFRASPFEDQLSGVRIDKPTAEDSRVEEPR